LLSPLLRLGLPFVYRQMAQAERQIAASAEVDGCPDDSSVYLLPGSDPTVAMYSGVALTFWEPQRAARLRSIVALSMTARDQALAQISADTIELASIGPMPSQLSPFEAVYRQASARVGDSVRTNGLTALVLAEDAGVPTRVRLHFARGEGSFCLLHWHRGALRRLQLAPGASLALPHEPGPMGF